MNNNFLHSGNGRPLRKVAASTGNAVTETTVLADGEYSETFSGSDCLELILLFIFAASATGDVLVQEVIDSGATVAGETYATITAAAERVSRWNAGKALTGTFRVKNTSGQSLTAYLQKRIN